MHLHNSCTTTVIASCLRVQVLSIYQYTVDACSAGRGGGWGVRGGGGFRDDGTTGFILCFATRGVRWVAGDGVFCHQGMGRRGREREIFCHGRGGGGGGGIFVTGVRGGCGGVGGNYNDFVIAPSLYLIAARCLILLRFFCCCFLL